MCLDDDGVERAAANEQFKQAGKIGGGGKDSTSERQMTRVPMSYAQ